MALSVQTAKLYVCVAASKCDVASVAWVDPSSTLGGHCHTNWMKCRFIYVFRYIYTVKVLESKVACTEMSLITKYPQGPASFPFNPMLTNFSYNEMDITKCRLLRNHIPGPFYVFLSHPRWLSGLKRSRVHPLMIARRSLCPEKLGSNPGQGSKEINFSGWHGLDVFTM